MSQVLGDLLVAAIGGVLDGKLYPGAVPDKPGVAPYAVYIYFGDKNSSMEGPSNFQRQGVQIDVYAPTYRAAEQMALDVTTAMVAQSAYGSPTRFSATATGHQYFGVDPDVKLHRVMLEFGVWYQP